MYMQQCSKQIETVAAPESTLLIKSFRSGKFTLALTLLLEIIYNVQLKSFHVSLRNEKISILKYI